MLEGLAQRANAVFLLFPGNSQTEKRHVTSSLIWKLLDDLSGPFDQESGWFLFASKLVKKLP